MKAKKTTKRKTKSNNDEAVQTIKNLCTALTAMLEQAGLNHPPHNDLVTKAREQHGL